MENKKTTYPDAKTTHRQNPCWINIQNYIKHKFFLAEINFVQTIPTSRKLEVHWVDSKINWIKKYEEGVF